MGERRITGIEALVFALGKATSVEEAAALLKQFLSSLGAEVEVSRAGGATVSEGYEVLRPGSASHWAVSMRPAEGLPQAEADEVRESLRRSASAAVEAFGVAVNALESRTRLASLRERLESATSDMHHDVRTPIAAIAGMAQTLRMRPGLPDEVREEFLQRMEESAHSIGAMSDAFRAALDALLAASGEPAVTVELAPLVRDLVQRATEDGREVEVELPPGKVEVIAPLDLLSRSLEAVLRFASSWARDKLEVACYGKGDRAYVETSSVSDLDETSLEAVPKTWLPPGSIVAAEEVQGLARPYHVFKALDGELNWSVSEGRLVLRVILPSAGLT